MYYRYGCKMPTRIKLKLKIHKLVKVYKPVVSECLLEVFASVAFLAVTFILLPILSAMMY